jgi:hypothetical protein
VQAKKVKASKGKKLHLFRDGFTLPSATEPADDAESTPSMLDRQSEPSNKVQSPTAGVKNRVICSPLCKLLIRKLRIPLSSVLAVINGYVDNGWP